MSGLFFDFAGDEEIWSAPYQYMLGRFLLIAPVVVEGEERSNVYLPEGDWIDFWNQDKFGGKQWIEVATPISRIPVFIKADAPEWVLTIHR